MLWWATNTAQAQPCMQGSGDAVISSTCLLALHARFSPLHMPSTKHPYVLHSMRCDPPTQHMPSTQQLQVLQLAAVAEQRQLVVRLQPAEASSPPSTANPAEASSPPSTANPAGLDSLGTAQTTPSGLLSKGCACCSSTHACLLACCVAGAHPDLCTALLPCSSLGTTLLALFGSAI
jgi:hypothetical protein